MSAISFKLICITHKCPLSNIWIVEYKTKYWKFRKMNMTRPTVIWVLYTYIVDNHAVQCDGVEVGYGEAHVFDVNYNIFTLLFFYWIYVNSVRFCSFMKWIPLSEMLLSVSSILNLMNFIIRIWVAVTMKKNIILQQFKIDSGYLDRNVD